MTPESIETPAEHPLNVTEVWLEALARGNGAHEAGFLVGRAKCSPANRRKRGWESPPLLDQYYRRGKIRP